MTNRVKNRVNRAIKAELPATNAALDEWAITRYAELLDERAQLRDALNVDGLVIREVIVSPKGDIAGERLVANPLLKEIRQIDRALDSLGMQLGLSPAARARITANTRTDRAAALRRSRFAPKE